MEIEGPDGTVIEFPDGTQPDIIKGVMAKRYPAPPSTGEDVGRSLAAGLGRGVVGLPGVAADMGGLVQHGVDWAARTATGKTQQELEAGRQLIPTLTGGLVGNTAFSPETLKAAGSQSFIDAATPTLPGLAYEPKTTAGKYARTIGEMAPNAALGAGGLARRVATQVVAPAVGSEAAGQATAGTALEPWARVGGAVAGGLAPVALSRAVTPFPATSAERTAAVNTLRNEGVTDITAGQATGSKPLQYFESEMGGHRAAGMLERQKEQFTAAALRRAGEDAPRANPEVVDQAFDRIGGQFNDLTARNAAQADAQLAVDLGRVRQDYHRITEHTARAPIIDDTIQSLLPNLTTGTPIPGDVFQATREQLGRTARETPNPTLSRAVYGLRNALDDAMERSMTPQDAAAWREARNQYRNMLVLERAVTAGGPDAGVGLLSPAQIRMGAVNQNRRSYARGEGDFADLARSGQAVMTPLPNSGTAARVASRGLPTAAAAMLGSSMGGAEGAGLGAILGGAVPHAMGHIAMTRPVQALLANQLLAGAAPVVGQDARRAALVQALRGAGQLSNNQQPQLPNRN